MDMSVRIHYIVTMYWYQRCQPEGQIIFGILMQKYRLVWIVDLRYPIHTETGGMVQHGTAVDKLG